MTSPHEHVWSDWYMPVFYRDSLGGLLNDVGMGRLSGTDDPATTGWVRACLTCDTEEHA
jgi:hypothetical protein